jgi:hypothetical protein
VAKKYFQNGTVVTPEFLNKINNPNFDGKDEDGSFTLPKPLPLDIIPELPADRVTSKQFAAERIPDLDAAKIKTGTLEKDRLPTVPIAKGGTGATTVAEALANFGIIKGAIYDQRTGTLLKIWTGTQAQYDALAAADQVYDDTIYFTDED